MKEKVQKPIIPTLKKLRVGDSVSFPIKRMIAVRTSCSTVNSLRPGTFISASADREKGIIVATRQS